jgi:hypothetical protein
VNYLAKLVARAASPQRAIAPRLPSRFEAAAIDGAPPPEVSWGGFSNPPGEGGGLENQPHTQTMQRVVEVERVIREQAAQQIPVPAPPPAPVRIERVESQREVHTKEIEQQHAAAGPPQIEREVRTERTNEKEIIRTHDETIHEISRVEVPRENVRVVEKQAAPVTERIMRVAPPPLPPLRGERVSRALRADETSAPLQQQPTIHVTIGRVDVRAVMPAASQPRAESTPKAPALSLDDYLAQRKGGSR